MYTARLQDNEMNKMLILHDQTIELPSYLYFLNFPLYFLLRDSIVVHVSQIHFASHNPQKAYILSMKFSIIFFFKLTTFLLSLPTFVDSKLVVTVILNDGDLPTIDGNDCNENDTQLITTTIGADYDDVGRRLQRDRNNCRYNCKGFATGTCALPGCEGYPRRNLNQNDRVNRLSAIRVLDDGDDGAGRRLNRFCDNLCRGIARGSCPYRPCKGYRRRNLKQNDLDGGDDEAICESGIAILNDDLDNMLPQLSESCRPVVQNNLIVSCFDDVRFEE